MSAQYVSSTFFRSVTSKTGRTIAVDIVDKTTAWVRPSNYPTESVKDKFADAAVRNADAFQPDVESVAMKEGEHPSQSDKSDHYTAYGLNKDKIVIDVKHVR